MLEGGIREVVRKEDESNVCWMDGGNGEDIGKDIMITESTILQEE